jgi:hypothetical protein
MRKQRGNTHQEMIAMFHNLVTKILHNVNAKNADFLQVKAGYIFLRISKKDYLNVFSILPLLCHLLLLTGGVPTTSSLPLPPSKLSFRLVQCFSTL